MSLHIVLHQPEIPANTGNISRACHATNSTLHLIHPLGFSIDDKMVKRAGLDYWKDVDVRQYNCIEELYRTYPQGDFYYIENFGTTSYTAPDFSDQDRDWFFVFGKETTGIPADCLAGRADKCLRIPMNEKVRSLNLANTVAIVMYDVLRQQGFPALS